MVRAPGFVIAVLYLAATPRPASADVLVLYADAHGGGMIGKATGGDDPAVKNDAFFPNAPNVAYGLAVSARFLFLGASIQHHQYAFAGGESPAPGEQSKLATWTQFTAGLDFNIGLGSDVQKKARKGSFVEVGAFAGFGIGTGQQVDPPLSNDEISDKGFLLGGKLGYGTHLSKFFDFGVMVPVSYGYFFKNGVPANVVSNHYQGVQLEALLFLRLNLKLL